MITKETLQREREVLNAIYKMLEDVRKEPFEFAFSKLEGIEVQIAGRVIDIEKQLGIRKQ